MKGIKPTGLVISGQLAESLLVRLPALAGDLGPVAAGSRRLASRYVNALRRGWAAAGWTELAAARVIFIQVPPPELPPILSQLAEQVRPWQRRVAVLLDTALDSSSLAPLAHAGASVASLTCLPPPGADVAMVEGDSYAVACLRRILRRSGVKTIHLKGGSKDSYNAGVTLCAPLAGVLTEMAVRSVRGSGVDPATAKRIVQLTVDTALRRALAKGGPAWAYPRTAEDRALVMRQLLALDAVDLNSAVFLRDALAAALSLHGIDPDWLFPPAGKSHSAGLH